jgi:hypothetical protein
MSERRPLGPESLEPPLEPLSRMDSSHHDVRDPTTRLEDPSEIIAPPSKAERPSHIETVPQSKLPDGGAPNYIAGDPEAKAAVEWESGVSTRETAIIWRCAIVWSVVVSLTIIGEGYDLALFGNFFSYEPFKNLFGQKAGNGSSEYIVGKTPLNVSSQASNSLLTKKVDLPLHPERNSRRVTTRPVSGHI